MHDMNDKNDKNDKNDTNDKNDMKFMCRGWGVLSTLFAPISQGEKPPHIEVTVLLDLPNTSQVRQTIKPRAR